MKVCPAGAAGDDSALGLREAKSNHGYLGQDDPVLDFGLGRHRSPDVLVTFAEGSTIGALNISGNQTIVIDGSGVR